MMGAMQSAACNLVDSIAKGSDEEMLDWILHPLQLRELCSTHAGYTPSSVEMRVLSIRHFSKVSSWVVLTMDCFYTLSPDTLGSDILVPILWVPTFWVSTLWVPDDGRDAGRVLQPR